MMEVLAFPPLRGGLNYFARCAGDVWTTAVCTLGGCSDDRSGDSHHVHWDTPARAGDRRLDS
jgi:hypothetical protein